MKFKYILICLLLGCLGSCSNTDCPLNNVVRCYYTLYSSEEGTPLTYSDTLSVYAADTLLLNRAATLNSFNLPMSYALPTDTLTFQFRTPHGNNTAMLYISHTNKAYFVSLDCPTSYFHHISGIEYTTGGHPHIDSVVIVKPEVNYEQQENIRIYLSNY